MSMNLFPSPDAALVFSIIIWLWILSELIGGIIIPRLRFGGRRVQQRNRRLNTFTWIALIAVYGVSIGFTRSGIALLPSWIYYMGIALMLLGIAIRQWAIAVLGRYFSIVIGIQKDQKVVETSPYHLVRHPSYTGSLLTYVGIGLAVQSGVAVLVVVPIFGLIYGHRMLVEEKVLTLELGNNYVEYMKRTKRLIPFLV